MKLRIPRDMAPAAVVDQATSRYSCRGCVDRSERIVLVVNEAHPCVRCGRPITSAVAKTRQLVEIGQEAAS